MAFESFECLGLYFTLLAPCWSERNKKLNVLQMVLSAQKFRSVSLITLGARVSFEQCVCSILCFRVASQQTAASECRLSCFKLDDNNNRKKAVNERS